MLGKLGAALCKTQALDLKEYFEACEFFLRTRKRVRRPILVDLACGHGLVGLLFAAFEPSVERVMLIDAARPPSHDVVAAAVAEVAPWALAKVSFAEMDIRASLPIPATAARGVVSIHACGQLTDAVLLAAASMKATVAVMPCCYTGTSKGSPSGIRRALGVSMAADIDRSYRLQAAGYDVDWAAIPGAVTRMNRILIGSPSVRREQPSLALRESEAALDEAAAPN